MLFLILHMSFWVKVGTSALDDLVAGKNYDKSLRPLYGGMWIVYFLTLIWSLPRFFSFRIFFVSNF